MANQKDNIGAAKAAAFEHAAEIGRREGQGAMARIDLGEHACLQGHEGVWEPDDAAEAWTRMSEASLQEQDAVGGSEQTTKQRISDIRAFIILGCNKDIDGPACLRDFKVRMQAIRSQRSGPKGRTWPMMLRFAQQQAVLKSSMPPKAMDKLCDLPVAPKRKVVDKFWSIRELLNAANERIEDKRIRQAINLIDETVTSMGGTKKQKAAAKKAAAKAKKAAKRAAKKTKKANGVKQDA